VDWVLRKSLLHAGMDISGDWFSDADYAADIATMDVDPQSLVATLADMEHTIPAAGCTFRGPRPRSRTWVLDLQLRPLR